MSTAVRLTGAYSGRVSRSLADLSDRQHQLISAWLPGLEIVADLSWGLIDTAVLGAAWRGARFIIKAGGESEHHLEREIRAHRMWLRPWTSRGRAPELVHADADAKILVTRYLPGELVLGSDAATWPDVYRQAGELVRDLHRQDGARMVDDGYEASENAKSLAWLDGPHRISADTERQLRAVVRSWADGPAVLVPTHGDWHPRNWLISDGAVSAIDFGRAALRPPATDLARLSAQEFRGAPELEAAFLAGYGHDPREPESWRRMQVREAIATAAWAFRFGEGPFEDQGHRMIADALSS